MILIACNPNNPRKSDPIIKRLIHEIEYRNKTFTLFYTHAELAENQAYFNKQLASHSSVIVVGGDGTFNHIINCLSSKPEIPLGLVASGTGNDFAKYWYKGLGVEQQIQVVLADRTKTIYLGACTFENKGQKVVKRLFHNSLGTGFDSAIIRSIRQNKALFRKYSYKLSALRNIALFKERYLELSLNERDTQRRLKLKYENFVTVLAKSPYFGGGLCVAPMADVTKPSLDMIYAEKCDALSRIKLLLKLLLGTHVHSNLVKHISLKEDSELMIHSDLLDLQADGEYIGTSPCKIELAKERVKLKSLK